MIFNNPASANNGTATPGAASRVCADRLDSCNFGQHSVNISASSDRQSRPPSYDSLFPHSAESPEDFQYCSLASSRSSSFEWAPNPTRENSLSDMKQQRLHFALSLMQRLASLNDPKQPSIPDSVFRLGPSDRSHDSSSLSSPDNSRPPSPFDNSSIGSAEFDLKMHGACLMNDIRAIKKLLLRRPAGIHRFQEDSQTSSFLHPLHLAAMYSHPGTLDYLCRQSGINVNIRDDAGQTPLTLAVKKYNIGTIELLCQQPGIDINARDNLGQQPLQLAVKLNQAVTVDYLCQQPGIALNARDETGQTPLMLAVRNGNYEIVGSLCAQKRTDINATDKSGKTALLFSIQRNDTATTQVLLEKGARVDGAGDNLYNSPFYAAIAGDRTLENPQPAPCNEELLGLLLTYGADPNQIIDRQHSLRPLHIAAHFGKTSAIDILVAHGANPRSRNDRRATPMHFAALSQKEGAMKRLLAHGATLLEPRGVIDRRFWFYAIRGFTPDPGSRKASRSAFQLCGRFHNKNREQFYCSGGQPLDLYLGPTEAMKAIERESVALRGSDAPLPATSCLNCRLM